MLTRATRIKLVVFGVIAVLVIGYTGFHYASLGRLLGLRGYYTVQMELANAGGIFPQADVTYRGVSVGRVGAVRLTPTGVEAQPEHQQRRAADPGGPEGQRVQPVRRRGAVRRPAAGHEQRALPHPGQRDPAPRHHAPAAGDQPADQRQRARHLDTAARAAHRAEQPGHRVRRHQHQPAGADPRAEHVHPRVRLRPDTDHHADRGRPDGAGHPERRGGGVPLVRRQLAAVRGAARRLRRRPAPAVRQRCPGREFRSPA